MQHGENRQHHECCEKAYHQVIRPLTWRRLMEVSLLVAFKSRAFTANHAHDYPGFCPFLNLCWFRRRKETARYKDTNTAVTVRRITR